MALEPFWVTVPSNSSEPFRCHLRSLFIAIRTHPHVSSTGPTTGCGDIEQHTTPLGKRPPVDIGTVEKHILPIPIAFDKAVGLSITQKPDASTGHHASVMAPGY